MKNFKRSVIPSSIRKCKSGVFPLKEKEKIREILSKDTNDCCAYCNAGNILASCPEIEHFLPKSNFPLQACNWDNLFLSCSKCNLHKSTKYFGVDEFGIIGKLKCEAFKPDELSYKFKDNFTINIFTGEIEPKNKRAETTIHLFCLNEPSRNFARKKELERFKEIGICVNYTFFIEEFKRI